MVEFVWLSVIGGALLLTTAAFDYRQQQVQDTNEVEFPAIGGPDEGSNNNRPSSVWTSLPEPVLIGYVVSLILQVPAVLSYLRVI